MNSIAGTQPSWRRGICSSCLIVGLSIQVLGCGSGRDGDASFGAGSRLVYSLTNESSMQRNGIRPMDQREIAGELVVVIRERSMDRIVFEVESLRVASVEDDLYEAVARPGGTIEIVRPGQGGIQAAVAISVNGAEETMFRGAMGGVHSPLVLDSQPPILRSLGLRDTEEHRRTGHFITIYATADGSPVPTLVLPTSLRPPAPAPTPGG